MLSNPSFSMDPRSSNYTNYFELPQVAPSLISSMCFLNSASCVISGSWGGNVQLWQISGNLATPVLAFQLPEAVLSVSEQPASNNFFTTSTDGNIRLHDPSSSTTNQRIINKEGSPVAYASFSETHSVLVTGSWSGEINFYDLRQNKSVHSIRAAGRIASMDLSNKWLVYGTNERELFSLDLQQSNLSAVNKLSPPVERTGYISSSTSNNAKLEFPIQNLKILSDDSGVVSVLSSGTATFVPLNTSPGSLGGSGLVSSSLSTQGFSLNLIENSSTASYDKKQYLSANSVVAHKAAGVFCVSGGNGKSYFVKKQSKDVLFQLESPLAKNRGQFGSNEENIAVLASCFDKECNYLVRAYGYDWYKGASGLNENNKNSKIFVSCGGI